MSLLRRFLSLEEASDGKANKEIEFEFYGRFTNLEALQKASSKESQEQWEIQIPKTDQNAGKGRLRVRKTTTADGSVKYIQTTKSILKKNNDRIEVPIPTTEDGFTQLKILAPAGMIKDRFCFPVGDVVFELDLYINPEGGYHEWCKVDVEVKDKSVQLPEMPFELEDMISNQWGERTEEEIKLIDSLFEKYFLSKNPYIS